MFNEKFVLESSWIHDIHPSLRIFTAILYVASVALFCEYKALSIALILSVFMVGVTNLKLKLVVKRLLLVSGFLLLLWVVLPLSYEPKVVVGVRLVQTGVQLATQITMKTLTMSLVFMVLVATMTVDTLAYSLRYLYVPRKMIYLLLVTYRYIFLVESEYRKIAYAIAIRNFRPRTNLHTYRTYASLVGMLFVCAYERATRIHHAMICRNFNGEFYTTRKHAFNWQSFLFLLCAKLGLIILWFLEVK